MIGIRSPAVMEESRPPGLGPAVCVMPMIIAYATLRGTIRQGLVRQKLCGSFVKLLSRIPLHEVFATVNDIEIELGIFFLEQGGALERVAAIVFAEHQQQRAGELDESLPHRFCVFCSAAALACPAALQKSLEVLADAHALAEF